jgi:uncharacterized protein (DUF58 family)
MKKAIFTLALGLLFASAGFAQTSQSAAVNQTAPKAQLAVFKWEKTEHDFKNIPQGTPVDAVFKFKNTGKIPLVISNAVGSCGCTVPAWPRDPIAPGETAEIKATFNAANPGAFNKSITVYANVDNGSSTVTIKGSVDVKTANQ